MEYNHPEFLLLFEKLYNIEALDDSEPCYTEEMQKRWDKSVDHALWSTFEEIDLSEIKPKKKSLINNDEDYFFNFNYTNVLEEIYNIENVIHIHGSVGKQAMIEPFMGH